MNTKLIMVEGIPGSGKSTAAKMIAEYYNTLGVNATAYLEGKFHPADLAWNAFVPLDRLDYLLEKYPQFADDIRRIMRIEDGYAVIEYLYVRDKTAEFHNEMESYEVYDGRFPLEAFCEAHYKRWKAFADDMAGKDEIAVFECVFLQNHVNELMLRYDKPVNEITAHLEKLAATVSLLEPVLIYLTQPDEAETLRRVSEQRVNDKGERDWMERVVAYVQDSPYGKTRNSTGFEGMVEYFRNRKRVELEILSYLPMRSFIIDNPDYNWNMVWDKIESFLITI